VAANHTFLSFNNATSACESTPACSIRTEASGWNVHKEWFGAYNATHADEVPACDGPVTAHKRTNNCATQITLNDGQRHENSCTSCKPGSPFVMVMGASRTGQCPGYNIAAKVQCVDPQQDGRDPSQTDAQQVCTKYVESQIYLEVGKMQDDSARAHYAPVMGGVGDWAIPRCIVRKETACLANGSCEVQKHVECVEVCRLADANGWNPPFGLDNCAAALCEGEYGKLACRSAAMME